MSKKDYVSIAKAIRVTVDRHGRNNEIHGVAVAIAIACKVDNRLFDWTKFMDACGFGE